MANQEQLDILLSGVEAWNSYRTNHPDAAIDLQGAHLWRAEFPQAKLQGANLHGANLLEAVLRGADLREAQLSRVDLRRAILDGANLEGADLREAELEGALLQAAELKGAELQQANLRRAKLQRSDLQDADLQETDLRAADLWRATLQDADLRDADMREADLREADLFAADLPGADLREADLFAADLPGADLREADLPGADLRGVNLQEADLQHADLQGANLQGADLQEANMQGADLLRANLQDANLQDANVQGADLLGATVESTKSQKGFLPAFWDFTDLSKCLSITQSQLDSMKGDSGTIIPDHLERPAHWPVLDLEPDESPGPDTASSVPPHDRATALIDRLADASPVEYGVRDGRLYAGDRPLEGRPLVDNPTDLEQRIQGQRALIGAIREELSEGSHNLDIAALLRWLDRYETALNQTPITWYETDDAIEQIKGILVEQDAAENWPRRQFNPCDTLCKRHKEMEPLLRPEQPEPEPEGATASPLAHLSEGIGDGSTVSEQLHEIADSDELKAVAEPAVRRDLENFAEEIDEIRTQDAFTPEQEGRKKGGLLKRLTKTAAAIAAFTSALTLATSSNVASTTLTNPEAAAVLLERMRALLDLLLKLF